MAAACTVCAGDLALALERRVLLMRALFLPEGCEATGVLSSSLICASTGSMAAVCTAWRFLVVLVRIPISADNLSNEYLLSTTCRDAPGKSAKKAAISAMRPARSSAPSSSDRTFFDLDLTMSNG